MGKSSKQKFYAVSTGRKGPKVYGSWDECKDNVIRYPGTRHKSFLTRADADAWIKEDLKDFMKHKVAKSRPILKSMPLPTENPGEDCIDMQLNQLSGCSKEDSFDDFIPLNELERPAVKLSPQQEAILNSVAEGRNVFYTGSAGTGKSVLLREVIRELRKMG